MPVFDYRFTVDAPVEAVAAFHHDTNTLKVLTPPPTFVQLHRVEPLAEGSVSKFTVWAGPLPIRWTAVHSDVSPSGFTDTQAEGVMAHWAHTHRFVALDDHRTEVVEHIDYEFGTGKDKLIGLLLFNRAALSGLFAYRKFRTRRALQVEQEEQEEV